MEAYYYGRLDAGNAQDKENGVCQMMLEELVIQLVNKRASEQDRKLDKALEIFQQSAKKLLQELKNELHSLQALQSLKAPKKRNF